MALLLRLDMLTLLVCLAGTTTLFSIAFVRTWLNNRDLKGPESFAIGFGAAALGFFLFSFVSPSSGTGLFFNTAVGDTLICIVFVFLLQGIERFFRIKVSAKRNWMIVLAASASLYFFTEVDDSMKARIVVLGLIGAILRFSIVLRLQRYAGRRKVLPLKLAMSFFGAVSLWQVIATAVYGAPTDYMRGDAIQIATLLVNLIFIIATGLLLFLLLNDELVMRLKEEAARDFTSGTLNRRGIESALAAEMERSRRHGAPLSVALLDLDFFKRINDTYGHAAGDNAIITAAQNITAVLRSYDHIGRFGGDEFLLVLPDTGISEAEKVLERIRVRNSIKMSTATTFSIGLTCMAANEHCPSLLARVDEALYAAKKDGRDRVSLSLPLNILTSAKSQEQLVKAPRRSGLRRLVSARRTRA